MKHGEREKIYINRQKHSRCSGTTMQVLRMGVSSFFPFGLPSQKHVIEKH